MHTMKVHFREQYGKSGEEILYVTPAGMKKKMLFIPIHKSKNK